MSELFCNIVNKPVSFGTAINSILNNPQYIGHIYRESWDADTVVVPHYDRESKLLIQHGLDKSVWVPTQDDMFAHDWVVVLTEHK